jgi:multidrug transporter EmrE-like cation transporter
LQALIPCRLHDRDKTLAFTNIITPPASKLLFAIAAALGAVGQYLYKSGADRAAGGIASYLLNPRLIGGVVCYVAVMVLFVAAFKRGGALTTLYPIYASTFIWAAFIARLAYGTPIKPASIAGIVLLLGGMCLLGR